MKFYSPGYWVRIYKAGRCLTKRSPSLPGTAPDFGSLCWGPGQGTCGAGGMRLPQEWWGCQECRQQGFERCRIALVPLIVLPFVGPERVWLFGAVMLLVGSLTIQPEGCAPTLTSHFWSNPGFPCDSCIIIWPCLIQVTEFGTSNRVLAFVLQLQTPLRYFPHVISVVGCQVLTAGSLCSKRTCHHMHFLLAGNFVFRDMPWLRNPSHAINSQRVHFILHHNCQYKKDVPLF